MQISESSLRSLSRLDASLPHGISLPDAFQQLRSLSLPLGDFARLMWSLPDESLPNLSGVLPRMAPEQVQIQWTGASGEWLADQSVAFIQSMFAHYETWGDGDIASARVLDYGCGYGHLARLVAHEVRWDNVYGVDPWTESIKWCQWAGLGPNFSLSDYLPVARPLMQQPFDLVYAFSVFTHLSERASMAARAFIRANLAPGGIVAITVRPREYWDVDPFAVSSPAMQALLRAEHDRRGFAFVPHDRDPVDGEILYGDCSISLERLAEDWSPLKLVGTAGDSSDPTQVYAFFSAE